MELLLQVATNWILPVIFFLVAFGFGTMIIVEALDSRLRWKAQLLANTIKQILGEDLADRFWKSILVNPLGVTRTPSYISANIFATTILHWLILDYHVPLKKRASTDRLSNEMLAALQPLSSEFPELDMIVQHAMEHAQTQGEILAAIEPLRPTSHVLVAILQYILEQAQIQNVPVENYYDHFHQGLKDWFYHATDQISSRYTRIAQTALLAVGTLIAAVANFDVINMVSHLWKASLLKELVDIAQKSGKPMPELDQTLFTTLPLGWSSFDLAVPRTPGWLIVKVGGITIGGFLIFISAQYIYQYVKRRTNAQYERASASQTAQV